MVKLISLIVFITMACLVWTDGQEKQKNSSDTGKVALYLVKEGPQELRKGQTGHYSVTVKNNGSEVAKTVFIRDFIPAGMLLKSSGKEITTGTVLRWNISELPPGESRKFEYSLDAIHPGEFINEAAVYMKGWDGSVHRSICKTLVVAPYLSLTKKGPGLAFLNRVAEYTITIINDGNGSAKDIVLVDFLQKGADYISSTPGGLYNPGKGENLATVTWKFRDIQQNQEINIKLAVRLYDGGRFTNIARLTSDSMEPPPIEPIEVSYETTVFGKTESLYISSYDTEDPVQIGKQTSYMIEVENGRSHLITNVRLVNEIDDELEFVSAEAPTSYKVESNKVIFEPVSKLETGGKLLYRIVCKGVKEGSAKNKAILTCDQSSRKIVDEEGTSVYK